jgi:NADH:ubiquinone oxidoreductase subunit E
MGSSCFARGNSKALENIENYISENNLEEYVELVGHLCLCNCKNGPNIKINGKSFEGLDPDCLVDLVERELNK